MAKQGERDPHLLIDGALMRQTCKMQLTGEDHGGTLRGFASFYMRTENGRRDQELLNTQMKRFQPPSR